MTTNRRSGWSRRRFEHERLVKFVCTDQDRHPRRVLGRITLRDGEAVSIGATAPVRLLYRGFAEEEFGAPIAAFNLRCRQCGRNPQVTQERMNAAVAALLAAETEKTHVLIDVSGETML